MNTVFESFSLFLILLLPLIGAGILAFLTLGPKKEGVQKASGWIATAFAVMSFAVSLSMFKKLCSLGAQDAEVIFSGWDWISSGNFKIPFALSMDRLSGVMSLVITGIGSLIHLYAIGYMSHDKDLSLIHI